MSRVSTQILTAVVLFVTTGMLLGQTPRLVHYQGTLTTNDGQPFAGTVDVEFRIYKSLRGDTPVWSEVHRNITVKDGKYEVLLGSDTPLKLSFFEYFLEMRPSGEATPPPRRMIVGSGYNYRLWFLFAAYTIVWLAIFLYVLSLARRQKKIAAEMEALVREAAASRAPA